MPGATMTTTRTAGLLSTSPIHPGVRGAPPGKGPPPISRPAWGPAWQQSSCAGGQHRAVMLVICWGVPIAAVCRARSCSALLVDDESTKEGRRSCPHSNMRLRALHVVRAGRWSAALVAAGRLAKACMASTTRPPSTRCTFVTGYTCRLPSSTDTFTRKTACEPNGRRCCPDERFPVHVFQVRLVMKVFLARVLGVAGRPLGIVVLVCATALASRGLTLLQLLLNAPEYTLKV
ncbi:hypothetical protein PBRA_009559 [Plasmodiophora brassicae]|uniref:Uncharacterized protein n=1 Tax=Plasmodiophora brassicae TaxID=37360 RepID=A0A0G4J931_PLABS|nr:hypothetical protein PBRA_009559 [Plasmodiophora brassicae]